MVSVAGVGACVSTCPAGCPSGSHLSLGECAKNPRPNRSALVRISKGAIGKALFKSRVRDWNSEHHSLGD